MSSFHQYDSGYILDWLQLGPNDWDDRVGDGCFDVDDDFY